MCLHFLESDLLHLLLGFRLSSYLLWWLACNCVCAIGVNSTGVDNLLALGQSEGDFNQFFFLPFWDLSRCKRTWHTSCTPLCSLMCINLSLICLVLPHIILTIFFFPSAQRQQTVCFSVCYD